MTPAPRRWVFGLRAILAASALTGVAAFEWSRYAEWHRPIDWQPFSRQAVRAENARGRRVLVSFMARWNPSATMQHHLIDTPAVWHVLRDKNIAALVADWTEDDEPEISAELKRLGQNGIPLLVVYEPGTASPRVLNTGILPADELIRRLQAF
jgi:thiol:disulfide interchange protein